MSENVVLEKSYKFALRIVRLYKFLVDEKHEFVMSKQVLTSGTDIGAHIKEAQESESRTTFAHDMNVALRKASLTEYWLQLLNDSDYLDDKAFASIHEDCLEIHRLLTSIVKTSRRN